MIKLHSTASTCLCAGYRVSWYLQTKIHLVHICLKLDIVSIVRVALGVHYNKISFDEIHSICLVCRQMWQILFYLIIHRHYTTTKTTSKMAKKQDETNSWRISDLWWRGLHLCPVLYWNNVLVYYIHLCIGIS